MKIILVLIDGYGDISYKIKDKYIENPLLKVKNSFFNNLIKKSYNGLMYSVESGLAVGSDTAHLNIFGYSPFNHYFGRGAFESVGSGIDMKIGDIAFKSNFATLDLVSRKVIKRRCDRNFDKWGLDLVKDLCNLKLDGIYKNYSLKLKHATEHRIGFCISGPNLSDKIYCNDPLKDNLELIDFKPFFKDDTEAIFTCELVI